MKTVKIMALCLLACGAFACGSGVTDTSATDSINGEVTKLQAEVKAAIQERDSLAALCDTLQSQVAAKQDAVILTGEERAILSTVKSCGGKKWLDDIVAMRARAIDYINRHGNN